MAEGSKVDGISLGAITAGSVFLYAAVKGKSVLSTIQGLVQGKSPATAASANQITGGGGSSGGGGGSVGGTPPDTATVAAYKAYAHMLLAAHGWAGQFASFNSIVMGESSWNPMARNPSSGAFGIAQALGHGNANTAAPDGENNYGNYGTSDSVCRSANEGHGEAQIQWMLNYIGAVYHSPDAAWAYHQAHGSY